jgi:hypothetical protein
MPYRFLVKFNRKLHFSFNVIGEAHKELYLLDKHLSEMLKRLESADIWEHTVFILVGNYRNNVVSYLNPQKIINFSQNSIIYNKSSARHHL